MSGASPLLAGQLTKRLAEWTGTRWMVSIAASGGAPSLRERKALAADTRRQGIAAHPVVAQILDMFPGSRILETRDVVVAEPVAEEDSGPDLVPLEDEVVYQRDEPGPDDSEDDDL